MGKKIIPLAKNVYDSLTSESRDELFKSGINFAKGNVEILGSEAQAKLENLLQKEKADGKISKKAQKLLKKMVSTAKKKSVRKAAKQAFDTAKKVIKNNRGTVLKNANKLKSLLSRI